MSIILIELTGAKDAAGTLETFYVSTDSFVTSPTDTPANTAFDPCVINPGSLGVHAYSDGVTGGLSRLESGEIVIANADGRLDAWLTYSFDGRAVTIRSGESSTAAYPSGFSTVFTGTVESVDGDWQNIVIKLKDKQFKLQLATLTTRYAGDNALPAGLEGVATDIKGKVKPRVYGTVYNISPVFVNTSKLTFQVSDIAVNDIAAVYDRGVLITKGADYATSALLQAAAPGAGTYITCFAEGYFRLGTTPAGQITADVVQGANAAARTAAQILNLLGTAAGLSGGEISSSDVTALDTANSNVIGVFISDDSTFQNIMDQVAASVGAFYGFDSAGVLRMGQLVAPTGTAVLDLQEFDIHTQIERRVPKDTGIPIWRATVNHTKLYTVQTSDLAGAVTAATRGYLAQEFRSVKDEDTSIKTQWLLSEEFSRDTLLTTSANAATEATRLLALYKVKRTIYDVPVTLSLFTANSLKLMDVVSLTVPRFGMTSGQKFRLIGFRIELATNQVFLSLWG